MRRLTGLVFIYLALSRTVTKRPSTLDNYLELQTPTFMTPSILIPRDSHTSIPRPNEAL